jgi:hypothetical protein
VTVEAILAQDILVGRATRQTLAAIGHTGVKRRSVALLAEGWPPGRQQTRIDRAVGSVTQGAVLRRWRVFPQKGTALVLVAAETIVVEGGLVKGRVAQTSVRVMAVPAGGFALGYGVARGQLQFGANLGMAVKAKLLRFLVVQCNIAHLMGAVTVVTAEVVLLVGAACPEQLVPDVVTALATGVACLGIGRPAGAETDIRGGFFAPAVVRLTGAVTGSAAGGTTACHLAVCCIENGVHWGACFRRVAVQASRLILGPPATADHQCSAQSKECLEIIACHSRITLPKSFYDTHQAHSYR